MDMLEGPLLLRETHTLGPRTLARLIVEHRPERCLTQQCLRKLTQIQVTEIVGGKFLTQIILPDRVDLAAPASAQDRSADQVARQQKGISLTLLDRENQFGQG